MGFKIRVTKGPGGKPIFPEIRKIENGKSTHEQEGGEEVGRESRGNYKQTLSGKASTDSFKLGQVTKLNPDLIKPLLHTDLNENLRNFNGSSSLNSILHGHHKQKYLFSSIQINYGAQTHEVKISSCAPASILNAIKALDPHRHSETTEDQLISLATQRLSDKLKRFKTPFSQEDGYVVATRENIKLFLPREFEIKGQTILPKLLLEGLRDGNHILFLRNGHYRLISGYQRRSDGGIDLIVNDPLKESYDRIDFEKGLLPYLEELKNSYLDISDDEDTNVPFFIIGRER